MAVLCDCIGLNVLTDLPIEGPSGELLGPSEVRSATVLLTLPQSFRLKCFESPSEVFAVPFFFRANGGGGGGAGGGLALLL